MEDYDYKVNTLECVCNVCDDIKLCLQCNDCFVTTCAKCINLIKCNNCNNLFTKYELELIGYKNYDKNINKIQYEIMEYLKLYNIDLSKYTKIIYVRIKELNYEIRYKIQETIKLLFNELHVTKDKKLVKIFSELHLLIDETNNNHVLDIDNDIVNEINRLKCKREIYKQCLSYYKNTIYIEYDIKKLEYNINCFTANKDNTKKHININNPDIKRIINTASICEYNCMEVGRQKHTQCDKICKYYLKYYENVKNKIQCPKCYHYNFMFKDCQQIYCQTCHILYDNISHKQEIFIMNPLIIYRVDRFDSRFDKEIQILKFNKYINTLPSEMISNLKNKKYVKKLNNNLNLCKIFKKQLSGLSW